MAHAHVVIHGRVQGVGFRAFVLHRAHALGVAGEVRNLPDGGVELHAEAELSRLEDFLDEVRRGPSFARIERFDVRRDEGGSRYRGFAITG